MEIQSRHDTQTRAAALAATYLVLPSDYHLDIDPGALEQITYELIVLRDFYKAVMDQAELVCGRKLEKE